MNLQAAKILGIAGMVVFVTTTPGSAFAGEQRPPPSPPAQKKAPGFSPEERAKRRQQIKERLAKQLSELQKKKAGGSISDEERQRLERLQVLANRFRNQGSNTTVTGGVRSPLNNSAVAKPKNK